MRNLMKRWANWSGSAEEATDEINRVLGEDRISLRTFQNYVSKKVVTRNQDRTAATYGRRQLLEVMATRAMLKGRWQIDEIAQVLTSYSDEQLAEIAAAAPTQPENPAVALVQQLKGDVAALSAPVSAASTVLRSHQPRSLRTPAPKVGAARRSTFQMPEVAMESSFLAAAAETMPAAPQARLVWRDGPIEISLDATLAEGETEAQLRERAQRLIDTAISVIHPRR